MPGRQRAELFNLGGKPVDFKTIDLQQTYDAAESGDTSAQFIASKIELGCYDTGIKHNRDNALILLKAGTEAGNEFCAVQLGVYLVSRFYSISGNPASLEDIELANKYLRFNTRKIVNHAERKSPYAQHILAQAYMYGIDTQTGSYNRGKASELSIYNLSNAILTSSLNAGVFSLAQKVWSHTEAWRNRVGASLNGLPDVQDLFALLQKEAKSGNVSAQEFLDDVHAYIKFLQTLGLKQKNTNRFKNTLQQSAGAGNPAAQYTVYTYFRNAAQTPTSFALSSLMSSAKAGYVYAQNDVGEMAASFSERNMEDITAVRRRAEYWYRAAAEQGLPMAQYNLAKLLEHGITPGNANDKMALHWYIEAAQRGHADATLAAAQIFMEGRPDVPQTLSEAFSLCNHALLTSISRHFDALDRLKVENMWDKAAASISKVTDTNGDPNAEPDQDGIFLYFATSDESRADLLLIERQEWPAIQRRLIERKSIIDIRRTP